MRVLWYSLRLLPRWVLLYAALDEARGQEVRALLSPRQALRVALSKSCYKPSNAAAIATVLPVVKETDEPTRLLQDTAAPYYALTNFSPFSP